MSALPPKADMRSATRHVRFVPIADIAVGLRHVRFTAESRHWLAATVDIGVPAKWWPMTRYKGAKAVSVTP